MAAPTVEDIANMIAALDPLARSITAMKRDASKSLVPFLIIIEQSFESLIADLTNALTELNVR